MAEKVETEEKQAENRGKNGYPDWRINLFYGEKPLKECMRNIVQRTRGAGDHLTE